MLNFSNHHSLKHRFQSALSILGSDRASQGNLSQLVESIISGDLNSSESKNSLSEAKAIILGLYYHQDLARLGAYFTNPEYLTVALAIALCCRGEMQPRSFISKINNYLQSYPDFSSQLDLADNLANQGASRAIATSVIARNSLAFGVFCFLSTPYSLKLVNRAGNFQVSISAIAAAYLGCIPNIETNNLGNQLGDRLLAAWAGVYDLSNIPTNFYPSVRYPQRISLGA
jgi:hypothetical protein